MTTGQFFELIERYKEGRLSEADWSVLREALVEGKYDEILEEDIRAVFNSRGTHESWSTLREQEIWKKVQARSRSAESGLVGLADAGYGGPANPEDAGRPANPGDPGGPARVVPFYRRRRFVWTAAAAMLILTGGVAFLFTPKEKQTSSVMVAATAIPPGSSRAILKLAGGQQVLLGKDARGAVASQGGMQIDRKSVV